MRAYKAGVLLLALVPVLAFARKKTNKQVLPAVFNQAQYVYVQAMDGDEFNPNLLPEDRQAIADVMTAIQGWKRYVLVYQRSQADLVFVVRVGRLVTGRGNVGIYHGSAPPLQGPGQQGTRYPGQPGNGTVVGAGGEVGPPDDLLWVCTLDTDGRLNPPLWRRTQQDGLDSPDVPLFKEFRREMDREYPPSTASKAKKP
ncbi:MAG TPA: hypothetical protein VGR47_22750 [Terracidiphilus sp.]|nr:hypothetical protein [Terracidiphilus sp.]